MRFRFPLFALLFIAGSLAVPHLVHAGIPFFGPIIPNNNNVCPASWGMFITVINNVISLLITIAIVFIAPLMIAWSGFLMVVNQGNSGKITEAKKILTNTVTGIVIALASWMVVDAIMAVLYNPGAAGGTWSTLINSGSLGECLPQAGANPNDPLNPATTTPGVIAVPPGGGSFTYDPGIDVQVIHESGPLATLLTCMAGKVPPGVGRISSISDCVIVGNCSPSKTQKTFAQCASLGQPTCSHGVNSCHYGGRGSVTNGQSYAVDFGDQQNMTALTSAATACGGSINPEGSHLHVSVPAGTTCSL